MNPTNQRARRGRTEPSEERKRFDVIATQLDPRTKMLSFCENLFANLSASHEGLSLIDVMWAQQQDPELNWKEIKRTAKTHTHTHTHMHTLTFMTHTIIYVSLTHQYVSGELIYTALLGAAHTLRKTILIASKRYQPSFPPFLPSSFLLFPPILFEQYFEKRGKTIPILFTQLPRIVEKTYRVSQRINQPPN
jgi:hypothetical protein